MSRIAHNLQKILADIRKAEQRFGRPADSVKLLVVSKGRTVELIQAAMAAGQTAFGESYLQEALDKIIHYSHSDIEWHFIGPIQSNKTKKIAEHFSWVQSVGDIKTARRLNEQRPPHLPKLNICLQVNISAETSKFGADPRDLAEIAEYCLTCDRLALRGLMAIPAMVSDFNEQRAQFHAIKELFNQLIEKNFNLDTLSMGMSADFVAAIAEGATIIRIGTAIFQ